MKMKTILAAVLSLLLMAGCGPTAGPKAQAESKKDDPRMAGFKGTIAKKYETPETVKFINGILGSFVRAEISAE